MTPTNPMRCQLCGKRCVAGSGVTVEIRWYSDPVLWLVCRICHDEFMVLVESWRTAKRSRAKR